MTKKPHSPYSESWNRPFDALGKIIQLIVYVPLLYIILMPWLSLLLLKLWPAPIFAGFFQAMASTGWLVASIVVVLAIAFELIRTLRRRSKERKRRQH